MKRTVDARTSPDQLRVAMRTHVGVVRERNEDSAYVDADQRFFIVADGMGGHSAGDVASALAVKVVRAALEAADSKLDALAVCPSPEGRAQIQLLLEQALRAANDTVLEHSRRSPKRRGMGTTLDVLLLCGNEAFVAHAGDSRIYLMRNGEARQVTCDHTVAQAMVNAGALDPGDVETSPMRSVLCNSVGCEPGIAVEHVHLPMCPGDRLLLCTDGLYDYFRRGELAERVGAGPGCEALDRLVEEACARGGHDNITGIIVELPPAPAAPTVEIDDAPTIPVCVPIEPGRPGPLAGMPDTALAAIVERALRETSRPHELPRAGQWRAETTFS